jgi:hypothetical protein
VYNARFHTGVAKGAAMSTTMEVCMGKKCERLDLQALLKIEV